jgi:hypothetical protein
MLRGKKKLFENEIIILKKREVIEIPPKSNSLKQTHGRI